MTKLPARVYPDEDGHAMMDGYTLMNSAGYDIVHISILEDMYNYDPACGVYLKNQQIQPYIGDRWRPICLKCRKFHEAVNERNQEEPEE